MQFVLEIRCQTHPPPVHWWERQPPSTSFCCSQPSDEEFFFSLVLFWCVCVCVCGRYAAAILASFHPSYHVCKLLLVDSLLLWFFRWIFTGKLPLPLPNPWCCPWCCCSWFCWLSVLLYRPPPVRSSDRRLHVIVYSVLKQLLKIHFLSFLQTFGEPFRPTLVLIFMKRFQISLSLPSPL